MVIRADLEELLWQKVREDLHVSRAEYVAGLADWDIEGVEENGVLLGVVMRRGPEFHFITTGGVPIRRGIVRQVLAPQLERYGYVETRTPILDARQHRFNRVVGFVATGHDAFNIRYRMTREGCRA